MKLMALYLGGFNLVGGLIDIYTAIWVSKFPPRSLVKDLIDRIEIYGTKEDK
jgi:hypothetical protein